MQIIKEREGGVIVSFQSPHGTALWRTLLLVPASELSFAQVQVPSSSGRPSTFAHSLRLGEQWLQAQRVYSVPRQGFKAGFGTGTGDTPLRNRSSLPSRS